MARQCKTPGAWYLFRTGEDTQWASNNNACEFLITIPQRVVLSQTRARQLERALHDAAEETMAPWFRSALAAKGE